MRGSWRGVEAARTCYLDLRHRKTNDLERVKWALRNYKQLAIKGLYTFARVVVLVVSMAVPDLAVAPRRGGKRAVRAGILGIRVIVIEREWEIKKISPLLLFASPQLTCWLSIYLRCRFAGYGFPRDSYAIANPRAFIPRSNSLFQPSYLLVLLRLPPSYSLT